MSLRCFTTSPAANTTNVALGSLVSWRCAPDMEDAACADIATHVFEGQHSPLDCLMYAGDERATYNGQSFKCANTTAYTSSQPVFECSTRIPDICGQYDVKPAAGCSWLGADEYSIRCAFKWGDARECKQQLPSFGIDTRVAINSFEIERPASRELVAGATFDVRFNASLRFRRSWFVLRARRLNRFFDDDTSWTLKIDVAKDTQVVEDAHTNTVSIEAKGLVYPTELGLGDDDDQLYYFRVNNSGGTPNIEYDAMDARFVLLRDGLSSTSFRASDSSSEEPPSAAISSSTVVIIASSTFILGILLACVVCCVLIALRRRRTKSTPPLQRTSSHLYRHSSRSSAYRH